MELWYYAGMIISLFFLMAIIIRNVEDIGTFLLVMISFLGILLMHFVHDNGKGEPLTSIETGDYSIVSYAETASVDGPMYQMILKQNNKIEFYALPKNMITIDKSNGKSSTLEVIEKASFKKAIIHP